MSSVILNGDTSGSLTLSAPTVAGSSIQTLAAVTGTLAPIVSGTAVTASGTSVDFTGIPSWVKRITVMFNGVSTSGTSVAQVQIGSGSFTTSGYASYPTVTTGLYPLTSGFSCHPTIPAAALQYGALTLTLITANTWVCYGNLAASASVTSAVSQGSIALSGALDRVRVTTVNGTDTFDAGSINILYE